MGRHRQADSATDASSTVVASAAGQRTHSVAFDTCSLYAPCAHATQRSPFTTRSPSPANAVAHCEASSVAGSAT